jgi:parvulin-like peptidyl-prolyl isomerase
MMPSHGPEVLAVVNGDSINTQELTELLVKVHQNTPVEMRANFDYRNLVTKLINDRLIIQEALAMGMEQEEIVTKPVNEFQTSRAISTFINEHYNPEIEITDEAIKARFENNYKRAQIRTLAVPTLAEANEMLKKINAGTSMDSLAKAVSIDSQRDKGGLHKEKYWKDVLDELRVPASRLKVGEISQPFKYSDSYMILKLEEVVPADPEVFGHAEATIQRSLLMDERKRTWDGMLDSLKALFPITVNRESMGRIQADSVMLLTKDFSRDSDQPLLSISGLEPIIEGDFRKKFSHKAMTEANLTFAEQLDNTLEEICDDFLLKAAAINAGYLDNPEVVAETRQLADSILIEKYLSENIASHIRFDDDKLLEIYHEDTTMWEEPGEIKLGLILCAKQASADSALTMLRDGANFDYVANKFGIKDNQYIATQDQWRQLSALPDDLSFKLRRLAVGGFADGTYQLSDGWGIFRLTARKPSRLKSYDETLSTLQTIYFQRQFNKLMDELLEQLKQNAKIEIYEDRITKFLEG